MCIDKRELIMAAEEIRREQTKAVNAAIEAVIVEKGGAPSEIMLR
jgi:hypothetical protein